MSNDVQFFETPCNIRNRESRFKKTLTSKATCHPPKPAINCVIAS